MIVIDCDNFLTSFGEISFEILYNLCFLLGVGEPDAAMSTLQRCLDQDSSYGDAHLLMARIYQERGNNSLASQYLESALSHNFEVSMLFVYRRASFYDLDKLSPILSIYSCFPAFLNGLPPVDS